MTILGDYIGSEEEEESEEESSDDTRIKDDIYKSNNVKNTDWLLYTFVVLD